MGFQIRAVNLLREYAENKLVENELAVNYDGNGSP